MKKVVLSVCLVLSAAFVRAQDVIKIGIIGLDTSHSTAFTELLNSDSDDPLVREFEIVAAYPYGSRTIPSSYNRIPGYIETVRKYGVEIVDSISELLGKVDCVLLETNDGRLHLDQAEEVFRSGKICYIDKPLGATLGQAVAICNLANKYGAPVFSSSALRFSPVNADIRAGKYGKVLGADCYSPHKSEPTHPDFGFYGIHGVETLYTVMGTGCASVTRTSSPGVGDVVTGRWADGRIGTFRAIVDGPTVYGGTVFTRDGAVPAGGYEGYMVLLREILDYFKTGKSPVPVEETLEIFAFMKASNMSLERGGEPVTLAEAYELGQKEADELLARKRFAVLDPGHFHSALVFKSSLAGIRDSIMVFAPQQPDQFLSLVGSYNGRETGPTCWTPVVYTGSDYLEKFATRGNIDAVVLAGNNARKSEYILKVVQAGYNVLSDKPMAIDEEDFALLEQAYRTAGQKGLVICELMTERYDDVNLAVGRTVNDAALFGTLKKGSAKKPAITMKSVHHFYKNVSGVPLTRPLWYYDTDQQGEGIADVTTHLIDLVMWQCFPGEEIDYENDVEILDAGHYPTLITLEEYSKSTGASAFPDYLAGKVRDGVLEVDCNGYILFKIKGITVRIEVEWNFEAPQGSSDVFTAVYDGTLGKLEVLQDSSTGYVKQLYLTPVKGRRTLIDVPLESRTGHEEHFGKVTRTFLDCISDRSCLPERDTGNTLAKYKITTSAVRLAGNKK